MNACPSPCCHFVRIHSLALRLLDSLILKPAAPCDPTQRNQTAYIGEVARLGREADRETREFVVDVRVKELPANWTIGQRAEVFIETGRKSGILVIPQPYLLWREGKPGVFVNDHGKARWRDLTPGLRGLKNLEVTQGLTAGEQIVKPPTGQKQPLADGQRITAK